MLIIGSLSSCKSHKQNNAEERFSILHGSETPKWILMKLRIYNRIRAGTTRAKLGGAVTTLVVLANTWHHLFGFLRDLSFLLFTWDRGVFPRKQVPCWGCVHITPQFGGQMPPQKNHFGGGMSRRRQAKRAKYSNFHTIKATAAIPTKSCTILKTYHSFSVVPKCTLQIQDGGWLPSL